MALATVLDLEKYGQVNITNDADAAVLLLLESATSLVEDYCGPLEERTGIVETFDVLEPTHLLALEQVPVQSISSVVEDGVVLVDQEDYTLADGGCVARLNGSTKIGRLWTGGYRSVVVTYDAGYADATAGFEIPNSVRLVTCSIALRIFWAAAARAKAAESGAYGVGGVQSVTLEGIGTIEYTQTGADGAGVLGGQSAGDAPVLLDLERQALSKHRRRRIA